MRILIVEDKENVIYSVAVLLVRDGFVPAFDIKAVDPKEAAIVNGAGYTEEERLLPRARWFLANAKKENQVLTRGDEVVVIAASCSGLQKAMDDGMTYDAFFLDSMLPDGRSDQQAAEVLKLAHKPLVRFMSLESHQQALDVREMFGDLAEFTARYASGNIKKIRKDGILYGVLEALHEGKKAAFTPEPESAALPRPHKPRARTTAPRKAPKHKK